MRRRSPQLPAGILDQLEPGFHADGLGLYLRVDHAGARRWVFVFHQSGRRREMGLGSFRRVTLETARDGAAWARSLLAIGRDPIAERRGC